MKFYVANNQAGEVVGCSTTLRMAKEMVRATESQGSVDMVEVEVTAENIRRLLGAEGGYSKSTKQVWAAP